MGARRILTKADDDNNNRICCMSLNESCYGKTDRFSGVGGAASKFGKWQERMKRQGRVSFDGADSVNHHLVSLCGSCS